MTDIQLPGRKSAAAAVFVCITFRLFMGMAVDAPELQIIAWLCPCIGLILALPFLLLIQSLDKSEKNNPWASISEKCPRVLSGLAALILILFLIYDCGLAIRLLAGTAKVLALNRLSVFVLTLPLGALTAIQLCLGAEASCNTARIWLRLAPIPLLIVGLVYLRSSNAAWLTPVLGSGMRTIASGAIYCSGSIALLCVPWLFARPDRSKRPLLFYVAGAVGAVALLLVFFQTLAPAMPGLELNRSSRIEQLLFNGRTALSMQFALILLWYVSLIQLISTEACYSSCLLKSLVPNCPIWLAVLLLSVLPVVLANSALTASAISNMVAMLCFPALMLVSCIIIFGVQIKSRRHK